MFNYSYYERYVYLCIWNHTLVGKWRLVWIEKAGLENDTLEEHIKEKVASTNHKFWQLVKCSLFRLSLGDISACKKKWIQISIKPFSFFVDQFQFRRDHVLLPEFRLFKLFFVFPKSCQLRPFALQEFSLVLYYLNTKKA